MCSSSLGKSAGIVTKAYFRPVCAELLEKVACVNANSLIDRKSSRLHRDVLCYGYDVAATHETSFVCDIHKMEGWTVSMSLWGPVGRNRHFCEISFPDLQYMRPSVVYSSFRLVRS